MPLPVTPDHLTQRRREGVYYTPAELASWMVRQTLSSVDEDEVSILDPACGAGIFLEQCQRWILEQQTAAERTWRLCGVDIDPTVVAATLRGLRKQQTRSSLSSRKSISCELAQGDALTGPLWDDSPDIPGQWDATGVNWGGAFPEVRARGGFDIILTNPPYRRERDARDEFARIAATPWGARWRQARMDLWYFFLHRSLDLLRPGGRVCMVVNSYWMYNQGASRMIERLRSETHLDQLVDFGHWPLFPDVTGRHVVFWLRKSPGDAPCRVYFTEPPSRSSRHLASLWKSLEEAAPHSIDRVEWNTSELSADRLYRGGRLNPRNCELQIKSPVQLQDQFDVRQGIAENPPRLSRRHVQEFPELGEIGTGVFVLSQHECEQLDLNATEQSLLRPYWGTGDLERYGVPGAKSEYVLYLTPHTAPALEPFPNLHRHLSRFRVLLERRREVQRGYGAWWHLHWPREERLFVGPRIVVPQMGHRPCFMFSDQPGIVNFSCHVIKPRRDNGGSPLLLCALLNSRLAQEWFEAHAKRRGANLDLSGRLLREFPLPARHPELESTLEQLVRRRIAEADRTQYDTIEQEIDTLVQQLYAMATK